MTEKTIHLILKEIICSLFTFPPSEVFGASRIPCYRIPSCSLNIRNSANKRVLATCNT